MGHVGYQSANAKKERGALLIAFSTGRPRKWNPGNPLTMHHAVSVSIAIQDFRAHHIRGNPSHIIYVLFYSQ